MNGRGGRRRRGGLVYVVPQQEPSARLRGWVEALPGLSAHARRLLLEGDTQRRYGGSTEGEAGFRVTAALAAMFSQPGRAFSQADFYAALVLRPTAGGAWARGLRASKGERYLEDKLAEMLDKARAFCAASPPLTNRADAGLEIARARQAVERHTWRGRAAGADEKNLVARLRLAEKAGGLVHQVSVRQLAELMGCARSTAEASNSRLTEQGWLRMLDAAGGRGEGSVWRLLVPEAAGDRCAAPGQFPPAGEGGQEVSRKRSAASAEQPGAGPGHGP